MVSISGSLLSDGQTFSCDYIFSIYRLEEEIVWKSLWEKFLISRQKEKRFTVHMIIVRSTRIGNEMISAAITFPSPAVSSRFITMPQTVNMTLNVCRQHVISHRRWRKEN